MEVGGASKVVVFLHGTTSIEELWYRVELENTLPKNKSKLRRKRICPVAEICIDTHGYGGGWDVIGDDIYWIGGTKRDSDTNFVVGSKQLLKHNIHSCNPRVWEIVSTSMKIPREYPFVAAVGGKKLYVLLGREKRPLDDDEDIAIFGKVEWNRCGEVYDIEDKTWHYLDPECEEFLNYRSDTDILHAAAPVNGEDDEPTGVALFDLCNPGLFFDFREQMVKVTPDFRTDGCMKPCTSTSHLRHAVYNHDMVFDSNTFYWFTLDLRLYGYDITCQTWFISPSLRHEFHILHDLPRYPALVGLGNANFLVIVDEPGHPESFTMASFTVQKDVHKDKDEDGNCFLSVSMKSLQAFSIDNRLLLPLNAKAKKLKNTAMCGQLQVMDNISDFYPTRKMKKAAKTFILTLAVFGLGFLLSKKRI